MPDKVIEKSISQDYKYGFETAVKQDTLPPGLDEGVIRRISEIKQEPEWLLEWRLKAYHHWLNMKEPNWAKVHYPSIDYKSISYYSAPRQKSGIAWMKWIQKSWKHIKNWGFHWMNRK